MSNTDQVFAVNKVKTYIETNLQKKMSLYELAQVAGYSPWYLSKIFKQYCGKTIFEYIRSLRLSRAAIVLRDNEEKVLDVAIDFIFDTHEGFTRAFSKEFGIAPNAYKKQKPPIKLFMPYPIREKPVKGERTMTQKASIIFTQVIERPKRKAIIKRGIKATDYFAYCEEVGCEVWGELCSIKGALYEPMGMWLPKKLIKTGTSQYVQGVEVPNDFDGMIPQGYDLIDLEPAKYMIFQGQKYDDKDFEREVGLVMNAIKEYDPTDYGFEWDDENSPRFQYEPRGERGYIEGKPVK